MEKTTAIRLGYAGHNLGKSMCQPNFHRAYLSASQKLVSAFENRRWNNEEALPIFFLQRHALELLLKDCLRIVYQLMLVEHELDKSDKSPSNGRLKRVCECHNLQKLYADLHGSLFLDDDATSDALKRLGWLVEMIHAIDESSTWARYPDVKKETCIVEFIRPQNLNLEFYQQEIGALSKLLYRFHNEFSINDQAALL